MMKNVSIRALFVGIGAVTLFVAAAMAAIGIVNVVRLGNRLEELHVSATAVRLHLEGDMMHDALRADVLQALVLPPTASSPERDEVLEALRSHVRRFRQVLADLDAMDLPAELHTHLRALAKPLDAYINEAVAQVERALRDRATAIASQPAFDTAFVTVEDLMEGVAQEIQALNDLRTAEGLASANSARRNLLLGAVVGVLLAVAGIWIGVRLIARPIIDLTAAVGAVAAGDTARSVPHTEWRNEIGSLGQAIESFKRGVEENNSLRLQQEEQRRAATEERRRSMLDLATRLETGVGAIVQSVGAAAARLQDFARDMTSLSEQATGQAIAVETSSQQATENVQMVAERTQELTASVTEISQQVSQSTEIIGDAVVRATDGSTQMQRLAEAANRIGDVITMINAIAGQTNLLALNATIEAARAGDAGRGFAVVASEVKALANQTSKATEEIRAQIAAIQEATQAANDSIAGIATTIDRVNQAASAISAAVEQQSAATAEIARGAQHAASGNRDVSQTIQGVTQAARQTGSAANDVLGAAVDLGQNGNKLRLEVDEFLRQVRAA